MKRESIFATKTKTKGPQARVHHMPQLNAPRNAPTRSWWVGLDQLFYLKAEAEAARMRNSRIHHQLQTLRIVGMYED